MQTALLEAHEALGAKIVDFCGWQMPLYYKGVIHEHETVRSHVGLFDISHMGRIVIEGLGAEALLDYLSTSDIKGKKDGTATYTTWCLSSGMTVDDLIVYRESERRFFVIVNACNREKDLTHLLHYSNARDVTIEDRYESDAILALQGPKALSLMTEIFPEVHGLKPMHFILLPYKGQEIIVSRTGYTGENGVEIIAPNPIIIDFWTMLLEKGHPFKIEPIGLAARDTLRLEVGYALYGHELSETIMPTESVSAWTIKWNKLDFLGKQVLEQSRHSPIRHAYGIILSGNGIARTGYSIFQQGQLIGVVTSGNFSPTLNKAIAIVLVEKKLKEGDSVEVKIRQNKSFAKVVTLPFYIKHSQYEAS